VISHATRRLPPEVAAVLRLCRWAACVGWHAAHLPSSQHDATPHCGGWAYSHTNHYDLAQVEVVTPEEHMGDVIGDLNSRRGMVGEFIDKPASMKLIKVCPPPPMHRCETLDPKPPRACCCLVLEGPLLCSGAAAAEPP